jgi:uncharacterized membrane protein YciS (DUF1049 family)
MKSKQTNEVSTLAYVNTDVEELIASVHLEIKDTAMSKAEQLAEIKLPSDQEDLNSQTSFIRAKYNTLKVRVETLLNREGLISKGESLKKRFTDKKKELKEKFTILENEVRLKGKELKAKNATDILDRMRRWKVVHPIIILILIGEAFISEAAFAALTSQGILARLGLGLLISMCTYFFVKYQVIQSRKIYNGFKRLLFSLGMTALSIAVLYALSTMRMSYMEVANPELAHRVSPLIYTLVALTMFLGSLFATSLYFVSNADRKRAKEYLKMKREFELKEKEFKTVDDELKALPQQE